MILANCKHIGLKHNCVIILREETVICKSYNGNFQILCNKILEVWRQLEMGLYSRTLKIPSVYYHLKKIPLTKNWTHSKCTLCAHGGTIRKLHLMCASNLKLFSFLNLLCPHNCCRNSSLYLKTTILCIYWYV